MGVLERNESTNGWLYCEKSEREELKERVQKTISECETSRQFVNQLPDLRQKLTELNHNIHNVDDIEKCLKEIHDRYKTVNGHAFPSRRRLDSLIARFMRDELRMIELCRKR